MTCRLGGEGEDKQQHGVLKGRSLREGKPEIAFGKERTPSASPEPFRDFPSGSS